MTTLPTTEPRDPLRDALGFVAVDPPVWEGELDGYLVCTQVQDVTHDVRSFILRSPTGHRFRQLPGQYVTVTVEIDGVPVSRCYTVTSPPTRPHTLSITVKRVPGGTVSNHLHDTVRPGDALRVDGPFGQFSLAHHPADRYLFLSAGSGITPLMAMWRTLHDLAVSTDVVFMHFARTPEDIIFRHELEAMSQVNRGIRLLHVVEQDGASPSWSGLRGRITAEMLAMAIPDLAAREAFVCGPGPFMTAAQLSLTTAGLPQQRYHQESFDFEALARDLILTQPDEPGDPAGDETATGYEVSFVKSGRTVMCRTDQFVLDAAIEAGLTLPSSCGLGLCGTCKTTLVSGTVDMTHQGGIRQREIDQGKVLICCSRPTSALVIDS